MTEPKICILFEVPCHNVCEEYCLDPGEVKDKERCKMPDEKEGN